MNPLQARLAALRHRLRLVVTVRGVCWLLAVVLATLVLAGWLDWRVHLPGLARAVVLVGLLSGSGYIGYRYLFQPLRERVDDLSLALRIEERYPALYDVLASTVQFLEQPAEAAKADSPSLRRKAVQQGLKQAHHYDFNQVVDAHGLRTAGLSLAVAAALALPLLLLYPGPAFTALVRLAHPFGSREWPPQTELTIQARSRIARGEPFEIRGVLGGVIPERAVIAYAFEGLSPSEQHWTVTPGENPNKGYLQARLEADRVRRNFRFQVRANDAVTPWFDVTVLPPPALVPLDGRPTPQVRLRYPPYTDLSAADLPDGVGNIETVVGTHVTLRAATDRPITRAWVEFRPEPAILYLIAALGPVGAEHLVSGLSLNAAGQAVWGLVPARLESNGRVFQVEFLPWVSGAYALHLEDETGLRSTRLFDLRLLPDPAPTVHLERPSASLDSLMLLPQAEITVQVLAEDPVYALRSVFLEYRCQKEDPPRRLPLYDHASVGKALAPLLTAFAAAPVPLPTPALRPRPQRLRIVQRLALTRLTHLDGTTLKEGDIVTLQACADDFDNVAVDKQPGRSHEIELRIVNRNALEAMLNQDQAKLQQELLRLREQEREAIKKVDGAEKQWKNTGRLKPEDIDSVVQAEQMQQQIRAQVGTRREEGLRADVARMLQTMKDNQLPRSGAQERMELAAAELDRLAHENLEQIEPLLTEARKENELAAEQRKPDKGDPGNLTKARLHQEEVEKTVNQLLAELEPYSKIREVQGEAKALLEEQRKLNQRTNRLSQDTKRGQDPTPQQQAELDKTTEAQNREADHVGQLLRKMERLVEEKNEQAREKERLAEEKEKQAKKAKDQARLERDASARARLEEEARNLQAEAKALREAAETLQEEVKALREAAELGRKNNIPQQMKGASQNIQKNQLGKAADAQKGSTAGMEQVVKALEDRREDELDRLIKKMKAAEDRMDRLTEEQEKLQKKVKEAGKIADPKEREAELKRLARKQEELRREAQEMARQLTRLRAERAGHELSRAGGRMDEAGQQMDKGQNADDQQEDALDRLDEARRELQRAREQAEEELAREKLAKIADQIKRLKERQEGHIAESARIHREVLQNKGWKRSLLTSLLDLAEAQKGLAQETTNLADQKLAGARIFSRIMHKSAEAMEQARGRMAQWRQQAIDRLDEGLDVPAENVADQETQQLQQAALRRLDQLLDALNQDKGNSSRASGGGQGQGGNQGGREGDNIPPLAQLKALRSMQEEVNRRTDDFAKQHPDPKKLTKKEQLELDSIRKDQVEVAELLDEWTNPRPEGGKQ